jgi:hypothetical protein
MRRYFVGVIYCFHTAYAALREKPCASKHLRSLVFISHTLRVVSSGLHALYGTGMQDMGVC